MADSQDTRIPFSDIAPLIPEPLRESFGRWFDLATAYVLKRVDSDGDFTAAFHDDIQKLVNQLMEHGFPSRPPEAFVIHRAIEALRKMRPYANVDQLSALGDAAERVIQKGDGGTVSDALVRLGYIEHFVLEIGRPTDEFISGICNAIRCDLAEAWNHAHG